MTHALIIIENAHADRCERIVRLHAHQLVARRQYSELTVFDIVLDERDGLTLDRLALILRAGGTDIRLMVIPEGRWP